MNAIQLANAKKEWDLWVEKAPPNIKAYFMTIDRDSSTLASIDELGLLSTESWYKVWKHVEENV